MAKPPREEADAAPGPGGGTHDGRAAALRDPQLVEAAARFVSEVLEQAKEEAVRRMREKAMAEHGATERGTAKKRSRWPTRARGFFTRLLAALCLCSSDGAKVS